MKRLILILFCLSSTSSLVLAQPNCPQPYNSRKVQLNPEGRFQLGVGVGLTDLKGDQGKANSMGVATYLDFDYKFYRGISVGVRSQFGGLKTEPNLLDARKMDSEYYAIGGGLYIQPLELIDGEDIGQSGPSIGRDIVDAFFIGLDALYLVNNIKNINRNNLVDNKFYGPVDYYDNNGNPIFKTKVSTSVLPSLNVGFAPALNKIRDGRPQEKKTIYRLVLKAQFNFTNTDDLDGYITYDSNMHNISKGNDRYNLYSVGLRVTF